MPNAQLKQLLPLAEGDQCFPKQIATLCQSQLLMLAKGFHALAEVVGLSPEGRGELEAHVTVPNEWLKQLPPLTDEDKRSLEEIAPYVGRKCARPASPLRSTERHA